MQISQYIYHNAALPVASHSAEVPWRSLCSASNTHNNLTELIAAEWRPTTGLFSEQGTFFFFPVRANTIMCLTLIYTALKVTAPEGLNVC